MRDLLECVWPAALEGARQPFRSRTWIAALWVIVDRDRGDLGRTRRLGAGRFEQVVRREITRRGGQKPSLRILRRQALRRAHRPGGVTVHRAGALERVQLLLADWTLTHQRLAETETRMTGVLDELGLSRLVTSITGVLLVAARRGGHLRHRRAVLHLPGAPTVLGPQQGLPCDAEYRVEAGERGQTGSAAVSRTAPRASELKAACHAPALHACPLRPPCTPLPRAPSPFFRSTCVFLHAVPGCRQCRGRAR